MLERICWPLVLFISPVWCSDPCCFSRQGVHWPVNVQVIDEGIEGILRNNWMILQLDICRHAIQLRCRLLQWLQAIKKADFFESSFLSQFLKNFLTRLSFLAHFHTSSKVEPNHGNQHCKHPIILLGCQCVKVHNERFTVGSFYPFWLLYTFPAYNDQSALADSRRLLSVSGFSLPSACWLRAIRLWKSSGMLDVHCNYNHHNLPVNFQHTSYHYRIT